ncbi:BTB/POZ domain-containing protein kctd3, variant 2 [Balamuthia mandrillaris]
MSRLGISAGQSAPSLGQPPPAERVELSSDQRRKKKDCQEEQQGEGGEEEQQAEREAEEEDPLPSLSFPPPSKSGSSSSTSSSKSMIVIKRDSTKPNGSRQAPPPVKQRTSPPVSSSPAAATSQQQRSHTFSSSVTNSQNASQQQQQPSITPRGKKIPPPLPLPCADESSSSSTTYLLFSPHSTTNAPRSSTFSSSSSSSSSSTSSSSTKGRATTTTSAFSSSVSSSSPNTSPERDKEKEKQRDETQHMAMPTTPYLRYTNYPDEDNNTGEELYAEEHEDDEHNFAAWHPRHHSYEQEEGYGNGDHYSYYHGDADLSPRSQQQQPSSEEQKNKQERDLKKLLQPSNTNRTLAPQERQPSPSSASSSQHSYQHHSRPTSIIQDSIVKLNIGGHRFVTTRSTLLKVPNTYFSILLGDKFSPMLDEEGAYFIDRDGTCFACILAFLRTGHLKVPEGISWEAVLCEMEYYGMLSLTEEVSASLTHDGDRFYMTRLPRPDVFKQERRERMSAYLSIYSAGEQHDGFGFGAASGAYSGSGSSPSSTSGFPNLSISTSSSSNASSSRRRFFTRSRSSLSRLYPPSQYFPSSSLLSSSIFSSTPNETNNSTSFLYLPTPPPRIKVTHIRSKFNLLCAAYEDGSIACWKYVNMAYCWRNLFMSGPQCLPSVDGLIMSATMTTTGQYTNIYLAAFSKDTSSICVWDQLHIKNGVKWDVIRLDLVDIINVNFMVNNCYLVAISSNNRICIFDLREPPERAKITYMSAPAPRVKPRSMTSPRGGGYLSPRQTPGNDTTNASDSSSSSVSGARTVPPSSSAYSSVASLHPPPSSSAPSSSFSSSSSSSAFADEHKQERVTCVAVVDPFSFLAFDDGTVCELAQHFDSHTHWEWKVTETWRDPDGDIITCLSCVVFTDRQGSNVLLTYGTYNGTVRLCSKVVNTKYFKLVYSTVGHPSQSIAQVMISESHRPNGGLIFSSVSEGGTIRTWRYLYVDLPQPHVSCIGCFGCNSYILDTTIYSSSDEWPLTQMVSLERNLESNTGEDGAEANNEGSSKVEAHLCILCDSFERTMTLYDDCGCICTIKPLDRSPFTTFCIVSQQETASAKGAPHLRNFFISGHENGSLQVCFFSFFSSLFSPISVFFVLFSASLLLSC